LFTEQFSGVLSRSFKDYHSEASNHLESRRIGLSSTRATRSMRWFLQRTSSEKKTCSHVNK